MAGKILNSVFAYFYFSFIYYTDKACFAVQNSEILVACQVWKILRLHRFDDGKLRCAARDILNEAGKFIVFPFKLKLDPGGGVFYIAPQPAFLDELMDKRPEADPLNNTVNMDQNSLHRINLPP